MNMKVRKSVIAFLMATTMVGSTAVPAMAGTITVKIFRQQDCREKTLKV